MANIPNALLAPWAITSEGLKLVVAVASRDEFFKDAREKALQAREGEPLNNARTVSVREGVAVIPVSGPLFRHAGLMADLSGATSYETVRKDLQAAVDDRSIKAILLDIDSPGGEVHGCGELSKAIFEARSKKPVVSYVSGMCASAAYWLGSAASKLIADPSAMVGSIGVRTMLVDDSKRDEQAGIKEYDIVSDQSPLKTVDAADAADRARVKEQLSQMAAVFIADVARNRGVSAALVAKEYGRGDCFIGQQAVAAGVIDGLGDFESVLSELASGQRTTGASMKAKASMGTEKCDGCERDMDDDEDMYCKGCKGYGASFTQSVLALVGASDEAEAIGLLNGMKQTAAEAVELKARLAKQELDALNAAFEAEMLAAERAGKITPSPTDERRALALSFKSLPNGLATVKAYFKTLDSKVPTSAPVTEPEVVTGAVVLTPEEKKMAASMGVKPEELAKNKARRLQMIRDGHVTGHNDSENAA